MLSTGVSVTGNVSSEASPEEARVQELSMLERWCQSIPSNFATYFAFSYSLVFSVTTFSVHPLRHRFPSFFVELVDMLYSLSRSREQMSAFGIDIVCCGLTKGSLTL